MHPNLNNNLVSYILSDEEVTAGCHLDYLQRGVIQNQRVEIIEQLASLTPSTMSEEGKETYWQQEAYLRGQLDILTHMLAKADAISQLDQPTPGN